MSEAAVIIDEPSRQSARKPLALAIMMRVALMVCLSLVVISLLNRWNTYVVIPFTGDTSHKAALATVDVREVEFAAADGTRLYGWVMGKDSARFRMIYCKGNGGYCGNGQGVTIGQCHALDVRCLVFDYRGYNRSAGIPGEAGTYSDARGAWIYATQQLGWEPGEVIIWGQSLGGAVATKLTVDLLEGGELWPEDVRADVQAPACLVVECAFTSIADMARLRMGFLGVPEWLAYCAYDNVGRAPRLKLPVFHMHGRKDEIIPFAFGERLDAALPGPRQTIWVDEAMHNDIWATGQDRLKPALLEFFAKYAGG